MVTATADNAPQAEHAASREWRVEQGAFLDGLDSSKAAQVAVIGRPVRDHLFGPGTNAVGERIAINGVPFFVKGVLGPYPELGHIGRLVGLTKEDYIGILESVAYVPFGGASAHIFDDDESPAFVVEVKDAGRIEDTAADVRDVLIRRRGRENFAMRLPGEHAFSYHHIARTNREVLIAVAVIGVLLAGLGVMSIMLVSVAERTREIGIRMALGARRRDILAQFLLEAWVPAVVGGVLGIALAYSTGSVLGTLTNAAVAFAPWFVPVALGCAVATGLVFGVVPARRAARLDPVAALATE